MSSIYKTLADFDEWMQNGKGTRKAVVYDQFRRNSDMAWRIVGTRKEILDQYGFFKMAFPDRSLGLVNEEYYEYLMKTNPACPQNRRANLKQKSTSSP